MRSAGSLIRNIHRGGEIFRCAQETRHWPALTMAYLGLKGLAYPYKLKLKGLQPLVVTEVSDIWTFWQIFAPEVYPVTGAESLIVDAGANIGFFTLLAARQAPSARVIAIEPSPETYRRLVENVENNQFSNRVRTINLGLAGHEETRLMRVGGSRSQVQRLLPRDSEEASGTAVRTVTLDSVLYDVQTVDLLKMDIEGGEYEVLYSASPETLRKIRKVILEYHPEEGSTSELLSYLRRRNFELTHDVHDEEGYGLATLQRDK